MLTATTFAAASQAETLDLASLLDKGLKWMEKSAPSAQQDLPPQTLPSGAPNVVTPTSMTPDARAADPRVAKSGTSLHDNSVDAPPASESGHHAGPNESVPRLAMSLVARDWKGAMAIAGGDTLPTDMIRLTRSSRMVLARVAIGEGKIVPFLHAGYGEWRYDPDLLPLMPHDQEFAAQMSGGVAIHISENAALAWEADYTVLCRTRREPQNHPMPHIFGSFAVLETRF